MLNVVALALVLADAAGPPRVPEPKPAELPASALAFNVGVASAVGELGVTYMLMPRAPLELEIGMGWGYSGMQLSGMAKLSFGARSHRVTTGIGIASTISPSQVTRDNPTWLNVDILGYEFRSDGRFFFALAVGLFEGLGGGGVCGGDCEGGNQYAVDVTRYLGPQGRMLVGATF